MEVELPVFNNWNWEYKDFIDNKRLSECRFDNDKGICNQIDELQVDIIWIDWTIFTVEDWKAFVLSTNWWKKELKLEDRNWNIIKNISVINKKIWENGDEYVYIIYWDDNFIETFNITNPDSQDLDPFDNREQVNPLINPKGIVTIWDKHITLWQLRAWKWFVIDFDTFDLFIDKKIDSISEDVTMIDYIETDKSVLILTTEKIVYSISKDSLINKKVDLELVIDFLNPETAKKFWIPIDIEVLWIWRDWEDILFYSSDNKITIYNLSDESIKIKQINK